MRKGFTLVEMIVVVGIVAILVPVVFSLVFGILRQQAKVYALKQAKREGDFLLNNIENAIRNSATNIYSDSGLTTEQCKNKDDSHTSADGKTFYMKDKSGNNFRFFINDNAQVSSDSTKIATGGLNETFTLSSNKVKILQNGNFLLCNRSSAFSPPVVSVSFVVDYQLSSFPENQASLQYQTKIKLRSY